MENCICEHFTENGKKHYKVWLKSLAEKWGLSIVYVGEYEDCIIKLPTLF